MSHLPAPVREKAVEIANALLRRGMDDGKAIRVAISSARHWAEARGIVTAPDGVELPPSFPPARRWTQASAPPWQKR